MDGLTDLIGGMVITVAAVAFAAGVATVGVGWLLWHYVLSHLSVGWA